RRAKRAELPDDIGKTRLQCRRDLEDERPRVDGLVDHVGHRQGVVAVFSHHLALRQRLHDRATSGFCKATLICGKYNSRSMDTRDTPEQSELRRTARRLARELGPRTVADLDDRKRSERLAAAVRNAGWLELRQGKGKGDGDPPASGVEAAIIA